MLDLSDASRPRRDVMGSEPPIEVVHFADPWCWWSWGLEPVLQRLKEVYGENLKVANKMAGSLGSFGDGRRETAVAGQPRLDWFGGPMGLTKIPVGPVYFL